MFQSLLGRAQLDPTLARISYSRDPVWATADADLFRECAPESVDQQRSVFRQFHPLCKPTAIFITNTSYLLPSSQALSSGRPERSAAFHFPVPVWYANAVYVMPHRRTAPEVVSNLCELARPIGPVPILARREDPGDEASR